MFNSLAHTQDLVKAGVSRKQAEAIISVITNIIETNLATKQDIKRNLRELELKLTIRLTAILGSLVTICTTCLAVLITFK